MRRLSAALLGLAALLAGALPTARSASAQPAADTMAAIRARGHILCGVTPNTIGFATPDSQGVFRGLDADYCRALAVAVFGDPEKLRFVPTTAPQRFPALQSGEVDVLIRTTTWTLSREAALGFVFAGVNFYDGNGFMVRKALGVQSARQLDGASVCLQQGSTTELNVTDYFRTHNMRMNPVTFENVEEIRTAFAAGRCDVYSSDTSTLAAFRIGQGAAADQYVLLPEIISKEPLGPAVRKGDARWFDIVRWTHFALLTAEELGITQANLARFADSTSPDVQRFLGRSGDLGKMLGLQPDWAAQIIRQLGNFGEMWERNITPMGIQRGINAQWTQGGLQYAPPMR
ncbi:amino acid ABC transporter substrate-binding protein [Pseudoroseomonas cervicalis]|uniref:amino acid ABC transporter substrate-binding protein n=1 Tax=Teichococcus cervicalis TaxID=204525 RepID=UPI0022F1CCA5|nr:amino acid ABC transporter substrate-binding protein [Pseudoroseomonas cervicalis]WBV42502.1 amino acid ABC transporter substrate-binding protein [Pseudoroseomonas cervicalis]